MLIHLLGIVKVQGIFLPNLFIDPSRFKSKHVILKELSALLLPFLGDINRLLARLGHQIIRVQVALDEYHYSVKNIAIGLRDALRLTRLVVSLLSSDDPKSWRDDSGSGEAIQNQTPGSLEDQDTTVICLSYELRYPCLSWSSKIHNVQIALNAMRGTGGTGPLTGSQKADDIRYCWWTLREDRSSLMGYLGQTRAGNVNTFHWSTKDRLPMSRAKI